jgi:hypothetical protein
MSTSNIDWVSVFQASHLNAEEFRDVASKFYDEAKELDKRRLAMKDIVKRHCVPLADDLNSALDLECEAGEAAVDRYISDT